MYYAVVVGRKTGVYDTWEECQKQTDKYKGAKFKKCKRKNDAYAYIRYWKSKNNRKKQLDNTLADSNISKKSKKILENHEDIQKSYAFIIETALTNPEFAISFTDGSYSSATSIASSASILFFKQRRYHIVSTSSDRHVLERRSVGAEISAVHDTLKLVSKLKAKGVLLAFDYDGVEKWAEKISAAKNPLAERYVDTVDEFKKNGKAIKYAKVMGHSGNLFNEMADELASHANTTFRKIKFNPGFIDFNTYHVQNTFIDFVNVNNAFEDYWLNVMNRDMDEISEYGVQIQNDTIRVFLKIEDRIELVLLSINDILEKEKGVFNHEIIL